MVVSLYLPATPMIQPSIFHIYKLYMISLVIIVNIQGILILFQAAKCVCKEIRIQFAGLNASEAKKLGRRIPFHKDWEDVKVRVMADIVRCKFGQQGIER